MSGTNPAQQARFKKERAAEERRLIEAAQGDRAAFADVYEKYFLLVYAYVARRTRSRDETEDLTADVFRKAIENISKFKWTGAPFAAWLFRIASNLIADRAKRIARDANLPLSELTTTAAGASQWQIEFESIERQAKLLQLVDELNDDQRRVVVMRFAEDRSIRDIADALNRSEGAVKQLQFRALKNLRSKLGKDRDE